MALVLKKLYYGYFWLFDDLSDPRADGILFSTPFTPIIILGCYLYFVNNLGPKLMKNRKPLDLKKVLIAYNSLQIICNAMVAIFAIKALSNMNWNCALMDRSDSPSSKMEFRLIICFHLLKLFDLLDTVFFVLRKSSGQINFLHVYHHCGMVVASYIVVKFTGGGELVWSGFINALVHIVMFYYYLLTVIDKKWKYNLKFKKFLTQIQLTQFVLNILIYGRLFFKPDCPYPRIVPLLYVPQNVFMLSLFGDFYLRNYVLKDK